MRAFTALALTLVLAGCAGILEKKDPSLPGPAQDEPAAGEELPDEGTDGINGAAGPADDLHPLTVSRAKQVLAEALNVPVSTIVVLHYEEAKWPDGCLGIPLPDTACTQAIVPGYRIVFRTAQGLQYVFRTDTKGDLMYTEPAAPPEEAKQTRIRGEVTELTLETVEDGAGNISILRVLLVEGEKEEDTDYARAWAAVPETARILRGEEEVAVEELRTGLEVEIVFSGPVAESDPVRGTAANVRILSGY